MLWVDVRQLREMIGRSHDVIQFAEEEFLSTAVRIPAAQRRKHHHDASLAERAGRLIVVRGTFGPEIIERVGVPTRQPDDGRVFLAITRIRRDVGRERAALRVLVVTADEQFRRWFGQWRSARRLRDRRRETLARPLQRRSGGPRRQWARRDRTLATRLLA